MKKNLQAGILSTLPPSAYGVAACLFYTRRYLHFYPVYTQAFALFRRLWAAAISAAACFSSP